MKVADSAGIRLVEFLIAQVGAVDAHRIVGVSEHGGQLPCQGVVHGIAEQEGAGDERRADHDGDAAGMSMRLVFRMSFKVMDHMVDSVPFFECFYSAFSGNVSRKPHSLWRLRVPSSAVHSSGLLSACLRPPRSGRRRTRAHGRA